MGRGEREEEEGEERGRGIEKGDKLAFFYFFLWCGEFAYYLYPFEKYLSLTYLY